MSTFDYSQFYQMSDPFYKQALRLARHKDSKWLDGETAIKLANGEPVQVNQTILLSAQSGKRPLPILWTEFPPLMCISKRLVDLFNVNQVTGWSAYPVKVTDLDDKPLNNYVGFAVTGRAGQFNQDLSAIVRKEYSWGSIEDVYMGFYFDSESWDGSDIFQVSGEIIVTRKVQQLLKRKKIINVKLTPLTEVETPTFLYPD